MDWNKLSIMTIKERRWWLKRLNKQVKAENEEVEKSVERNKPKKSRMKYGT